MFFVKVRRVFVALRFSTSILPQDINCFVSFCRYYSLYGVAALQFLILVACLFLQVRHVDRQKLKKAILDSWKAGIPTNTVLKILLEEKTFEAPISLFLQSLEQ